MGVGGQGALLKASPSGPDQTGMAHAMHEEVLSGACGGALEDGFLLPAWPTAGMDRATLTSRSCVIRIVVQKSRWDLGG